MYIEEENVGFTNRLRLLRGPVLLLFLPCGLLPLAGGVACSLSTAYNLKSGRNNLFLPDNTILETLDENILSLNDCIRSTLGTKLMQIFCHDILTNYETLQIIACKYF